MKRKLTPELRRKAGLPRPWHLRYYRKPETMKFREEFLKIMWEKARERNRIIGLSDIYSKVEHFFESRRVGEAGKKEEERAMNEFLGRLELLRTQGIISGTKEGGTLGGIEYFEKPGGVRIPRLKGFVWLRPEITGPDIHLSEGLLTAHLAKNGGVKLSGAEKDALGLLDKFGTELHETALKNAFVENLQAKAKSAGKKLGDAELREVSANFSRHVLKGLAKKGVVSRKGNVCRINQKLLEERMWEEPKRLAKPEPEKKANRAGEPKPEKKFLDLTAISRLKDIGEVEIFAARLVSQEKDGLMDIEKLKRKIVARRHKETTERAAALAFDEVLLPKLTAEPHKLLLLLHTKAAVRVNPKYLK